MAASKEAYQSICLGCMADKGANAVCRLCGFDESTPETHRLRISPRTVLKDQYLIGRVLGQGGFGITYLGLDLVLHKKVAIKEFMPSMLATRGEDKTSVVPYSGSQEQFFQQGLQSFLGEARSVAHFSRHVNIVNVNNYFEANHTGYMVMDYLDGVSLSGLIVKRGGRIQLREALSILFPVLEALGEVHKVGIYHRDISPQNVIITSHSIPVLIDFGAARQIVGEQSYSLDVVLKHGYSPLEQYTSRGKIGPWSDVYACGATLYHMITGKVPPPSVDRVDRDELIQPSDIEGLNISEEINDALLTSLAVRSSDRFQTVDEFRRALERKGYTGYRKLLETFLSDGKSITLENRIILDKYLDDHLLNHDDAKLIEETLREELRLPGLDWSFEYRENYERYSKGAQGEAEDEVSQKLHETYVAAKRISHMKERDIVRAMTEGDYTSREGVTVTSSAMSTSTTSTVAPASVVTSSQVGMEPGVAEPPKKGLSKVVLAAAACAVLVIAVVAVVFLKSGGMSSSDKPVPGKVPPVANAPFGFINVWTTPPVEIYVNEKLMGVSPQSKIKVPAGQVTIRLVSKQHNIDETYTEYVEPYLAQFTK